MILTAKPGREEIIKPKTKFRLKIYNFVNSKFFQTFIMVCIICNIITMAIVYEGASTSYLKKLEKANLFFTFSFVLEAILKLISYGIIFYYKFFYE